MDISLKISEVLEDYKKSKDDTILVSIEFFPPKSEAGLISMYGTAELLNKEYNLSFVDVTWGAGGSTSDLTFEICSNLKSQYNLNPNMHLTCTNVTKEKVIEALNNCKLKGITNILALRGDPPIGETIWKASNESLTCALDLVKFIRIEYQEYFHITVAGYPEGHPSRMTIVTDINSLTESEKSRCAILKNDEGNDEITVCKDDDYEKELDYLKQKVDAGANCIITQLFFDVQVFLTFVTNCREKGITVPIIPGIMCINSSGGFIRMTKFCKTRVPKSLMDTVLSISDDSEMRLLGISYGTEMCMKLLEMNIHMLHFYTLNTSVITQGILFNLTNKTLYKVYQGITTNHYNHQLQQQQGIDSSSTVFDQIIEKETTSTNDMLTLNAM